VSAWDGLPSRRNQPDIGSKACAGPGPATRAVRARRLHDMALLSLTRADLAGRILLGLTEGTTCSDLSRILGRFHRLHPQLSVEPGSG